MTDNNTQSILFELQKNLEDLSSAKMQMEEFRSVSKNVVYGIDSIQKQFVKQLSDLELEYKKAINKVEEEITFFLGSNSEGNQIAIQKIGTISENAIKEVEANLSSFATKSKEESKAAIDKLVSSSEIVVKQGIDKFNNVAEKVELSNTVYISAITELLNHYKRVVETGNSLINTLNSIDFPSKLDALSSKSQLIIEAITNSKQALEIKLNEVQSLIIDKTTIYKDQIIQNSDVKFLSLNSQVNSTKDELARIVFERFKEQREQTNQSFENVNTIIKESLLQISQRQDKLDKRTKVLKWVIIAIGVLSITGSVMTILILEKII